MAKTKISEWSTTPASNTDIDGINIAEGCAPSGINDAIRDLMAQVRSWQSGASGDPFNGPMNGTIGATTAYSGAFTTLSASGTTTLSGLTASTALALDASKNVVSVANTGSGSNVLATSPTLVTPALGTPSSATLTNATGLPISTGVSGLGTGVATALAVNVGSAGAPVVNGGALGTPSSGTVTNLTGTASININGTVGATTPTTGAFTTTTVSTSETLSYGTANGVTYLNGSKVLTTGSALTFDGTNLGVGLSNPSAYGKFVVNGSANVIGGNYLYMWDSGNTNAPGMYAPGDSIAWKNSAGSTEWMRINGTGLGIGTSSPSHKLSVAGGVFSNNSTNSAFLTAGSQYYGSIANTSGANTYSLGYSTDGSTHSSVLYWNASGNLGLGVTPSAWTSSVGTRALQLPDGNLWSFTGGVAVGNNYYYGSGGNRYYINSAAATEYYQTAGTHVWRTAASGTAGNAISFTQAMTLDASGNLGIGTTSTTSTTLNIANEGTKNEIVFRGTSYTNIFSETTNGLQFGITSTGNSAAIEFFTANTERARIDSSGNFMIGQTSTNRRFAATHNVANFTAEISNSNGTPYGIYVLYDGAAPNNTVSGFIQAADTAGLKFEVRSNGGVANYSANNVNLSDRREKTNFAPAGEYLSKICAIPIQTFNYIDQNMEEDAGLTLGVVAQDVQAVAPELVMESNWAKEGEEPKMRLSIYQTDLQYALMKCIQELKAEFDAYKASHP